MSCKTCQRLFRAADTPAVDYSRKKKKKNTKDLCNTQHENKFLDLNMESDSGFHTEAVKYNQEQRGNPKCS